MSPNLRDIFPLRQRWDREKKRTCDQGNHIAGAVASNITSTICCRKLLTKTGFSPTKIASTYTIFTGFHEIDVSWRGKIQRTVAGDQGRREVRRKVWAPENDFEIFSYREDLFPGSAQAHNQRRSRVLFATRKPRIPRIEPPLFRYEVLCAANSSTRGRGA